MNVRRAVAILLFGAICAQAQNFDTTGASLTITTDPPGAFVFVNAESVGVAPVTVTGLPNGIVRIRITPPDFANWLSHAITDSLQIKAGETISRTYPLPRRHIILSSPSGAEVVRGDSVLGTTPFTLTGDWHDLVVKRPGYEVISLAGTTAERGIIAVNLKKSWQAEPDESPVITPDEDGSSLRLYLAGAATVVSGATAAYFKVKADNRYAEYLRSGNAAALDDTNRLDTAAAIALVATQLSMGLFTYFILSE